MIENTTKRLSILPTNDLVALPDVPFKIQANRDYDKRLLNDLEIGDRFVVSYTNNKEVYSDFDDIVLPGVRTSACVVQILDIKKDEGDISATALGVSQAFLRNFQTDEEKKIVYADAVERVEYFRDVDRLKAVEKSFLDKYKEIKKKNKNLPAIPKNLTTGCQESNKPYCYLVFIGGQLQSCQMMLDERDPIERYRILMREMDRYDLDTKIEYEIQRKVSEAIDKNQREFVLREKMKVVKDELKEFDGGDFTDNIEKELKDNPDKYPENIRKRIENELARFKTLPGASQEAGVINNYLDLLVSLPWKNSSTDNEDLSSVKDILDKNHNGLEKQKDRILQYLAVKQLTHSLKAPILCLYGAPGVGKTSLAISIAEALNRKFVKLSLGGISDEAEIRGHRKTYVGAMPGKIISLINKCGTNNPVFLLDEIDKIDGGGYHGDPASALLEVLDPEQNNQFYDNYMDESFDLSNVLFICTANDINKIPAPLMDRLEMIELETYTKYQKIDIAKSHLIQLEEKANGITSGSMEYTDEALDYIIENYTMEAGVRELRRKIGTIDRKFAVQLLKDKSLDHLTVTRDIVREYLGPEVFLHEKNLQDSQVGVINGLAYTQAGGEVLKIEVNTFPGKGSLIMTGNLGDVMKEACETALSYVKSIGPEIGIDPSFFMENDIHIHFPESATPKDGPSAGAATVMVIISAITGLRIRNDVAMTGEVDLRGNVMPIGGLREKSNAATREHVKKIFIPKENHRDRTELPKEILEALEIQEVSTIKDLFSGVFMEDITSLKEEINERTKSKAIKR